MAEEHHPTKEKEIIYVPAYPEMMAAEEGGVDLLQFWRVIWEAKWFVIGVTLAATLVAVFVTLFVLPVTYRSEAVLLPAASKAGGMGTLGVLADSLPVPLNLPGGSKTNQIMSFLQSRNLQQRLIEKYDLLPRFYKDAWDVAKKDWKNPDSKARPTVVKALQANIFGDFFNVAQDMKTNLISISWEDEDPAFAALMLRRLIAELTHYLDNEYESDAQRERQFVEGQLVKATQELEHWEKQVPSKELTMGTIQRERLGTQAVYTELRKQVELARIAEAKELVRFKVLDPPFVPEQKFKPKRSRICAFTLIISAFLAVFLVFVRRNMQGAVEA
jgi:uncharacterized protein involved in exopolysaccharide biosynthesis